MQADRHTHAHQNISYPCWRQCNKECVMIVFLYFCKRLWASVVCCRRQKLWIQCPLIADASSSFLLLALGSVLSRVFWLVKWLLQMERLADDAHCSKPGQKLCILARLQTWRALIFSWVCLSVCLSVCFWPALLPFNVNRFWRNLVTRTYSDLVWPQP